MEPQRYRCAPAFLLAGAILLLAPLSAPAQGKFSSGLRNAMNEVSDLIDTSKERDDSRFEIRKLEAAFHELMHVHDHGHAFGHQDHHHGHFTSGLKSTTGDVTKLLGMAVEHDRSRSDLHHLDRALHDLLAAMEHGSGHQHSRVQDGARNLCPGDGAKAKGSPQANLVGNRVAQKSVIAAPGSAKQGPSNKKGAAPGNLVGNRATSKNAATVKNNGGPMQHQVKNNGANVGQACAKQGVGNFAGSKNAGKNTLNAAVAKNGPAIRQFQPNQVSPGNLVGTRTQQACAKNGPGNFASNKNAARLASPTSVAKTSGQAKQVPGNLIGSRPMMNSNGAFGNQAGVSKHGAGHSDHQAIARNGVGNLGHTASVKSHFTTMPHFVPQHVAAAKQGHSNSNIARRK